MVIEMNWYAISAIGEVIGAGAVVISLIYLAAQIRQNTRQITNSIEATQLAAFERNIQSGNRVREFLLVNPDLFELYMKGNQSYLELSPSEKIKFGLILRNIFSEVQGSFIRQTALHHDPQGFHGLSRLVDEIISTRGVQEYLRAYDPDWRPEFRQFIYGRLALIPDDTAEAISNN